MDTGKTGLIQDPEGLGAAPVQELSVYFCVLDRLRGLTFSPTSWSKASRITLCITCVNFNPPRDLGR